MRVPKPVNCAVPNTHQPRLCVWTPCQELAGSGKSVVSHLELSSLDVNRHDPPAVPFLHLRSYPLLIDLLAKLSELFLAVTRPSNSHDVTPFLNLNLPRLWTPWRWGLNRSHVVHYVSGCD